MARYIDADIVTQEIEKLQTELESNNDTIWNKNKPIYKGLCYARGIIDDTPTADVVPKSEVEELIKSVDDMLDLVCAMTGLELTCFGKYAELKKKYIKGD
jgi:hypothetical protein